MSLDPYHQLLTTRYVCEACLTRYFVKYGRCAACQQVGRIRPLANSLATLADDDAELRRMIAAGQRFETAPGLEQDDGEQHS